MRRDFLPPVLRREMGVLEGLEGGLVPPVGGRSVWMLPEWTGKGKGAGETTQLDLLAHTHTMKDTQYQTNIRLRSQIVSLPTNNNLYLHTMKDTQYQTNIRS